MEEDAGGGRGGGVGRLAERTGKDAPDPRRSADRTRSADRIRSADTTFERSRSTAPAFDPRGSTSATVDLRRSTAEAVDPRRSFLRRLQNDDDPDMDKKWMRPARSSTEYSDGVRRFIQLAVRNSGKNGQILCPCSNCGNRFWLGVDDVHEHLICAGFMSGYITWIFHGECLGTAEPIIQPSTSQKTQNGDSDEIEQLLVDGFGIYDSTCLDAHSDSEEESDDDCDEAAETFRLLSMEGSQELYAGCKRFSKLQFLVRLLNIKNNRRVSNAVFEDMLELFRDALPEGQTLPKKFHELKKFIKAVGLGYDSHHACYNDCIIFRGQYANGNSCPVCKSSRWKTVKTGVDGKRISKVPQPQNLLPCAPHPAARTDYPVCPTSLTPQARPSPHRCLASLGTPSTTAGSPPQAPPARPAPTSGSTTVSPRLPVFPVDAKRDLTRATMPHSSSSLSWSAAPDCRQGPRPCCRRPHTTPLPSPDVDALLGDLNFLPGTVFTTDLPYVDFLDRVHKAELKLRGKGMWEVPHPWLNLFVPASRIADFDRAVFRGILGSRTSGGPILIYPMNKHKWDPRSSVVTPDEEVFYLVAFLRSALPGAPQSLEALARQNRQILDFCSEAGISAKQYLPNHKTQPEWEAHFGPARWARFAGLKTQFDPRAMLATGQGIFPPPADSQPLMSDS